MKGINLNPLLLTLVLMMAAILDAAVPGCASTEPLDPAAAARTPAGFITFAVNCHDWVHSGESAETLLRLIGIYQKHGVRGDFYLTAPLVEAYREKHPEVIAALQESGMGISYHFRPPHGAHYGFNSGLAGLSDEDLRRVLRGYETLRLDLETGKTVPGKPGGYALVRDLLGTPPVVIGCPVGPGPEAERIRRTLSEIYRELGARAAVVYHETGTKVDRPFEYRHGLLARPSDFSVTRWPAEGRAKDQFWWNMLDTPQADTFDPLDRLQFLLAQWNEKRPPFITSLIHENNFYRRGKVAWGTYYYEDTRRGIHRTPPFDLTRPDESRPRSKAEREKIWAAYERMVAWAADNLEVVTAAEIVRMAEEARATTRAR